MNGYQSFYVRPCLEFDGGTQSYACHNQFYADLTGLQERKHNNPDFEYNQFWTVYGVNADGLSDAISDCKDAASANDMMSKIINHSIHKNDDCFCNSEHAEHRDVQISDLREYGNTLFPDGKPWAAITSENMGTYFATEDEACAFQRHWRELMHLNPMTGEFLIEA